MFQKKIVLPMYQYKAKSAAVASSGLYCLVVFNLCESEYNNEQWTVFLLIRWRLTRRPIWVHTGCIHMTFFHQSEGSDLFNFVELISFKRLFLFLINRTLFHFYCSECYTHVHINYGGHWHVVSEWSILRYDFLGLMWPSDGD